MTDTDVAWCAGFFDGEGHVSYRRGYPSSVSGLVTGTLMCSVPQNTENIEVLQFFQSVVGLGKIKGPYASKKGKTQHRLIFATLEIEKLIGILRPYLKSEKTRDFQTAIMAYYLHDPNPTRDDWERWARHMKKKGK